MGEANLRRVGVRNLLGELMAPLLIAVICGVTIGTTLAVWIGALNGATSSTDQLMLVLYLSSLYTTISVAVAIGGSILQLVLGIRPSRRNTIALLVTWYLLANGATRYITSVQFMSFSPHMSVIGIVDIVVLLTAILSAGWGIVSSRALLGCAVATFLIFALEALHRVHEPTPIRDLTTLTLDASGRQVARAPFATAPAEERLANTRVAILAIDGQTWDVLVPLFENGESQNFRALVDGAAFGHLETLFYSRSPPLWESIATGRRPLDHGVGDHSHFEFPGVGTRIAHLPHFPLSNSVMGVNRLLVASASMGAPWRTIPASSLDARAARFWDVASREGVSVGIFHWYNTTPVTPVRGFIIGGGSNLPRAFPAGIDDEWAKLEKPTIRAGVGWVENSLPYEKAQLERFFELAKRFDPKLLAYYTHFGDGANHLNWKSEAQGDGFFISGIQKPDFYPGPAILMAQRFIDELLGEFMARLPAEATLIVVSDHGFEYRGYEHDNAPPGILIVRGPEIRPGVLSGATVYDVAPTVLHLLGLPVADDMAGNALRIARPGTALDRDPSRVASHGPAAEPIASGEVNEEDLRQHEEYLRALGYVN